MQERRWPCLNEQKSKIKQKLGMGKRKELYIIRVFWGFLLLLHHG
jgi:hypothetical protein